MTRRRTSEQTDADDRYDAAHEVDEVRHDRAWRGRAHDGDDMEGGVGPVEARDRFGGTNVGAAFFGWLVAVAMAVLLSGVVGTLATALGTTLEITRGEAEEQVGSLELAAAAVLVVVMLVAYYTGGYVAGRMSRFDGGRQGLAMWLIGMLMTALAVGLGLLFGREYDVLARVELPSVPVPADELGTVGLVAAVAIVVGTALVAMVGGKVGHRYHDKVDRAAFG